MEITQNYYPDSLIEASLSCDEQCGGGGIEWWIDINPPSVSLKVVLIENAASQTFSLGKFYMKQNNDSLLKIDNVNTVLTGKSIANNYFPKEKLKPNETIVLPLRITLKTTHKHEFVYGPVQSFESIEINNDNYAVRKEDTHNIFMYESQSQIGSCPYIYTFSKDEGRWLLESHILPGNSSKQKEKVDRLLLKRFNGQVQLRENDPETSFIDYLYIQHVLPDGTIKILRPTITDLKEKDGRYYVLNKGDKLLLDFPKEDNMKGTYSVISFGYYLRNM